MIEQIDRFPFHQSMHRHIFLHFLKGLKYIAFFITKCFENFCIFCKIIFHTQHLTSNNFDVFKVTFLLLKSYLL